MYDIIIIGAGPAGISAAIYGKSRGKNVLVLEKKQVGGLIGTVSTVTHYTAIVQGESGSTFAERMKEQFWAYAGHSRGKFKRRQAKCAERRPGL